MRLPDQWSITKDPPDLTDTDIGRQVVFDFTSEGSDTIQIPLLIKTVVPIFDGPVKIITGSMSFQGQDIPVYGTYNVRTGQGTIRPLSIASAA